jgi:hypothetical protein
MSRLAIIPLLFLTACSATMDMQGMDPNEYYAKNKIENKVGPNGELISPPNCPDWRMSPVTTYSNTKQANIGCATVTNLGLMLEDPRDLERGSSGGHVPADPQRSSDAIRIYRNAIANPPAAADSAPDTSSASGE